MSEQKLDLAQMFGQVTQVLAQQRETLNAADTHNHDHGDHVVEVFALLAEVARENPGADAGELLALASQRLREKQHGTAQVYAQNLSRGAQYLRGKPLTQQTLPLLIQALLGAPTQPSAETQQAASTPTGGLGDLLGGQAGRQPEQAQGGDVLGSLLVALTGQQQQQAGGLSDGLDLGDALRAGMAFLQASQRGESPLEAALDALLAATGMGQTPHRAQSAKLVVQALLQAAQGLGGSR